MILILDISIPSAPGLLMVASLSVPAASWNTAYKFAIPIEATLAEALAGGSVVREPTNATYVQKGSSSQCR